MADFSSKLPVKLEILFGEYIPDVITKIPGRREVWGSRQSRDKDADTQTQTEEGSGTGEMRFVSIN